MKARRRAVFAAPQEKVRTVNLRPLSWRLDAAVLPYSPASFMIMSIHAPPISARLRRWMGAFLFATMVSPAGALAEGPAACGGEVIATAAVARVLDGRTFVLDDGREVRLAGIEVAALPDADGAQPGETPGSRTKAALETLLAGGPVTLKKLGAANDRYGRVLAQAFVAGEKGERWVQAEMVASGYARVSPRIGDRGCMATLLARERAARDAKLGLWAEPYYVMQKAEDHAAVATQRGRFVLVEGKVLSVRESGGTIYVNFGRRWSEDFTVTIAKRNARIFTAAGLELKKLQGRVVRIRGWIEERGGPWVDASRPEQIEVIEAKAK
jgi:endonuclease YncB( thermonuclease family)